MVAKNNISIEPPWTDFSFNILGFRIILNIEF